MEHEPLVRLQESESLLENKVWNVSMEHEAKKRNVIFESTDQVEPVVEIGAALSGGVDDGGSEKRESADHQRDDECPSPTDLLHADQRDQVACNTKKNWFLEVMTSEQSPDTNIAICERVLALAK